MFKNTKLNCKCKFSTHFFFYSIKIVLHIKLLGGLIYKQIAFLIQILEHEIYFRLRFGLVNTIKAYLGWNIFVTFWICVCEFWIHKGYFCISRKTGIKCWHSSFLIKWKIDPSSIISKLNNIVFKLTHFKTCENYSLKIIICINFEYYSR